MTMNSEDDLNADSQGMLLVMFNAIQALAVAHPNLWTVRELFSHANEQQIDALESGAADQELIEAYAFYSGKMLDTMSSEGVPLNIDLQLKL